MIIILAIDMPSGFIRLLVAKFYIFQIVTRKFKETIPAGRFVLKCDMTHLCDVPIV